MQGYEANCWKSIKQQVRKMINEINLIKLRTKAIYFLKIQLPNLTVDLLQVCAITNVLLSAQSIFILLAKYISFIILYCTIYVFATLFFYC